MIQRQQERRPVSRRRFLATAGSAVAGLGLAAPAMVRGDEVLPAPKRSAARVLRLAHLTDIHVQPERAAGEGLAACLRHVHGLQDRPDLIVTGGDTVMDSFGQDDERTTTQWSLFHEVMKAECSLPVKCCIGNHDTWGWNKKESKTTGDEPLWGKKRAVKELGIPNRYYRFDQAGWRFIILDSTHADGGDGYVAKFDEEQYAWLRSELAGTPAERPVLIVTHEPILSAAAFFDGENETSGNWELSASLMHIDARRLKDLFNEHPRVKLCLSGHLHLVDRVDYCGVTYLCDGAVSGAWWKGHHQECVEGYGLVDLYDDGTFAHQYVAYNWKAVPESQEKST